MFSHTNRRGVTYYIHEIRTKTGKRRYTVKRDAEGARAKVPEGFEVVENVNGQVSIRTPRPRLILPTEEQRVQAALRKHDRQRYRIGIKGRYITIHEPNHDIGKIADILSPVRESGIFGPGLDKLMIEKMGDAAWEEYLRQRREKTLGELEQTTRYSPVLRFRFKGAKRRRFSVERMCYRGEGGWLPLRFNMTLAAACERYVPLLGTEAMFDER